MSTREESNKENSKENIDDTTTKIDVNKISIGLDEERNNISQDRENIIDKSANKQQETLGTVVDVSEKMFQDLYSQMFNAVSKRKLGKLLLNKDFVKKLEKLIEKLIKEAQKNEGLLEKNNAELAVVNDIEEILKNNTKGQSEITKASFLDMVTESKKSNYGKDEVVMTLVHYVMDKQLDLAKALSATEQLMPSKNQLRDMGNVNVNIDDKRANVPKNPEGRITTPKKGSGPKRG